MHHSLSDLNPTRLAASPHLAGLEFHAEIASTNDRALELAADPTVRLPLLVLAHRQTAGRGRGTNAWWSADGALTFSLILDPQALGVDSSRWPCLSLASAVAVCRLLERRAPHTPRALKWPNDVFLAGRKVSGILVEVTPASRPDHRRLVLGLGLNVNNSWQSAPAELAQVGTSLCDHTGTHHDRTELLLDLLHELHSQWQQLVRGDAELPRAWQSLCMLRGRSLEVAAGSHQIAGRCEGIAEDGRLLVAAPDGTIQRIAGGTIQRFHD